MACALCIIFLTLPFHRNTSARYVPKRRRFRSCCHHLWTGLQHGLTTLGMTVTQGTLILGSTLLQLIWFCFHLLSKALRQYAKLKRRLVGPTAALYQEIDSLHRNARFIDLTALSATTMATTNSHDNPIHTNNVAFDMDAAQVGIDNRCSACISHDIDYFEGILQPVNRAIKGFGGTRTWNVQQGTNHLEVL